MPKKRGTYRPRAEIGSYTGPYRRSHIEYARETLIGIIESKDTILWDRIKMKTGIGVNCEWNGKGGGFGDASCSFSHADLPQHDFPQHYSPQHDSASGSGTSNSQVIDLTAAPDRDNNNSQAIDLTAAPDRDTSLETPDTDCIIIEDGHRTTTDRSDTGYGRDSLGKGMGSAEVDDLHCGSVGDAGVMDGSKVTVKDEHRVPVQQEQIENESMSDGYEEMVDDDSIDVVQEDNRGGESIGTIHVHNIKKEVSSPTQVTDNSGSIQAYTVKKEPTTHIQDTNSTCSIHNIKNEPTSPTQDTNISGTPQAHNIKKEANRREATSQVQDRNLKRKVATVGGMMTVSVTDREGEVSASGSQESMHDRAVRHTGKTAGGSSEPVAYAPRVVLKCDFCAETANNPGLMMRHLKQSVHYSASSFHCSGDMNNLTLHNRLVLTNKNALFKSVLAVCPADNCDIVFKTIYDCSLHYKKKHDYDARPTYALCSVTEEVCCDINKIDMHCPVCKLVALNQLELTQHIAIAKHYPFEQKAGLHPYFYCRLCQQFRPTFSSAYYHRTPDHKGKMRDGVLRLSVLYGTEKVVHHLPDITQSSDTKREREPETVLKKCKLESGDMVGVKEGYKCDYCDMASDVKDAVMSHMKAASHPSASSVLMDSSLVPVYFKRPLVLQLNTEKRAVMAICPAPNCDLTFMNPHYCCEHYSQCHGQGVEPTYAVSKVNKEIKLKYKWDNDSNSYTLPADVKTQVTKKLENTSKCFVCSICKLTICSHDKMVIHLRQKHKGEPPKQRTVRLFWLSTVKVTQPVLTYQNNERGELLAIDREIESLKELKKTSTKKSKKSIRKKIRALKVLKYK